MATRDTSVIAGADECLATEGLVGARATGRAQCARSDHPRMAPGQLGESITQPVEAVSPVELVVVGDGG